MDRRLPHYSKGLSLVELMIASVIGLLLLTAILSLFLSSKRAYNDTERFGRIQENGRYALDVLAQELRQADFWGESRRQDIITSIDLNAVAADCTGEAAAYNFNVSIWGTNATSATVVGCVNNALSGSDLVVVKHVEASPTPLAEIAATNSYLMSNQATAMLFDGADTVPTTTTGGLVPSGQAWAYQSRIFYVGGSATEPALYRKQFSGNGWSNSEKIADGIERVHFLFGLDQDSDAIADVFLPAANVTLWENIVAVRIYILARNKDPDKLYKDAKSYQLGDVTVSAQNDGYHRMVFEATVSIRNRHLQKAGGF